MTRSGDAGPGARILIVEDEMLVAADLEATLEELGYHSVGIAPDMQAALTLSCGCPDLALVDFNLRDGATGPAIGSMLSERGVTVVFLTANPRMLGDGVPGTVGVMGKPSDDDTLEATISYALSRRRGEPATPPSTFSVFGRPH